MKSRDAISKLPLLTWRNLDPVPCDTASYDFAHVQAVRARAYIDAAGHDHVRREPLVMPARLYFLDTLIGGKKLFSEAWPLWRAALFDGSSALLQHPDLGPIEACVLGGHVELTSQIRSGVIVDVRWTETVSDPEADATEFETDVSAADAAAALDAAMSAVFIPYPTGEPETSFFEMLAAIEGAIISAQMSVEGQFNRLEGMIANNPYSRMQGHIETVIGAVESAQDHAMWPVKTCATALWNATEARRKTLAAAAARGTGSQVVGYDTTLTEQAAVFGNTVTEIMGLNVSLLTSPRVPKGSVVRYYT